MIEGTPVEHHADETGHTEFKPSPFRAGTIDCQQCPWQDPPSGAAQRPTEATEALADVPIVAEGDSEPAKSRTGGPTVPPLDLRARIANEIDRHMTPLSPTDAASAGALVEAIHAVVSAGADFSDRTENAEMTPAQALAYLLDLPEWARIDRLSSLLGQAHAGMMCRTMGHDIAVDENLALRIRLQQLNEVIERICRLCSPPEPPLAQAPLFDVIGQLAAEALTGDQ